MIQTVERERDMQFDRIPSAMRAYPQFVVWRYEPQEGSKPKKNLYSPRWGTQASSIDPNTWGTFDEATATYERGGWEGIGFVFTRNDPFAGIDLDDSAGDATIKARQDAIYDAFPSYAELSPSGTGLHIIVIGDVPKGRRRANIEVYSNERFFTMTGNVYRDAPIIDCNATLQTLWEELGGEGSGRRDDNGINEPQRHGDDEIRTMMFEAINGDKARKLHVGEWQTFYPSQSEADFALLNIIAYYTDNREQVERIFRALLLYRDERYARRPELLRHEIARAFDKKVVQPDFSAITEKLKGIVDRAKVEHGEAGMIMPPAIFPIIRAAELAGMSIVPLAWHVADMVPARTVTLLGGDGGTGKSLLALQLAYATAAGIGWINSAVRPGPCLFVTAEDDIDEVHRRLAAIALSEGPALDRLPHALAISSLAGRDALLALPDGRSGVLKPTALFEALAAYIATHRPALIILDTLADLFGGEENNRAQARQFVGALRGLALEFDTTVLLLAHPSLTGMANGSGLSGSTAWNNSVRSRLFLKRDPNNPHYRILETMKSNYGSIGGQSRLEWRSGVFIEASRTSKEPAHMAAAERAADELFLRLLADFTTQGRTVSAHASSRTHAALMFAQTDAGRDFKRSGFEAAMHRLFEAKRIRIIEVGSNSKRKEIIALAADAPSDPFRPPSERFPTPSDPGADPLPTLFRPTSDPLPSDPPYPP